MCSLVPRPLPLLHKLGERGSAGREREGREGGRGKREREGRGREREAGSEGVFSLGIYQRALFPLGLGMCALG